MLTVLPAVMITPSATSACEVRSVLVIARESDAFSGSPGKSPSSRLVSVFSSATAVPSALMATASPASMMTPFFMSTMAVEVAST